MNVSLFRKYFVPALVCVLLGVWGCSDDDSPTDPGDPGGSGDSSGTVTDIDGNVYQTVTIGDQVWMAENLKVTHYRNGDPIPNVASDSWSSQTTGAYCSYNNDPGNSAVMGMLYNNYAATDSRNIAPSGWRVASDSDWQTLLGYLGGEHVAGGKLKETGFTNWSEPNTGATNESGFAALPSGGIFTGIGFTGIGYYGYYWSSSLSVGGLFNDTVGSYLVLLYDSKGVNRLSETGRKYGLAVRCVRD